ncbi:hypothetical protein K443DRAFT_673312 [Laccaria amethystina LaAM-08-1]|uniref:RNA-binding domain-containing protein n=1 Tax=Laccaria amethystina LaAM-08-1 TaxID=1095629 RepID=A0A0C9Y0E0_9AGAR|nr:hypothetical protein K443DRAFT_673312 [Laccaria amethystina LaAM-08-1]
MAAPNPADNSPMHTSSWAPDQELDMGPGGNGQPVNGAPLPVDDRMAGQDPETAEYPRGSSVGDVSVSGNKGDSYREKQVKPNKVYIGGLPEHTRQEDLQSCFGKIGNITNIELKVGYGFVEFDTREAAEESVAKYHEGFFMGNKIRVELSHGGGRTAKYAGDPGACFKCGQMGHWARECPNHTGLAPQRRHHIESPLIDRIQRDHPVHPARLPLPRDDYGPSRYPPRDLRYDYPPPPAREYRRPPSPRDYREYSAPPTQHREEYRRLPIHERDRFAPPLPTDFARGRYPPPPDHTYRGYANPPPPPPVYDRYDRRAHERYPPSYAPVPGPRPRTPPRVREDFERLPPRDYPEYRGRPVTPPRYVAEYPRVSAEPPAQRYRRRSESPPPGPYDRYSSNGYLASGAGNAQPAPPHGVGRDYVPPRNGREPLEPVNSYRRP